MNPDIPALKDKILQLKELHDSGALSKPLYEEGRAALERQLLDRVLNTGAGSAPPTAVAGSSAPVVGNTAASVRPADRLSPRMLALLSFVVLGIAGAGYWWTGSPSTVGLEPAALAGAGGGQGSAGGSSHLTTAEQIEAMTEKLTARLKEQPRRRGRLGHAGALLFRAGSSSGGASGL